MHRLCGFWVAVSLACAALGQAVSERVGVTAAGNNLAVRPAPCSASSLGAAPSGMDGAVLGASQACNNLAWLPTRWANGLQGWTATGASGTNYLAPLAGQGVFPNVSAPLAYPVRVGPNASALNVRTGPGTEHAIVATKSAGAIGWAYEVFNNTAANTVWWKIRWDDGVIGWSAEGVRGAGVYLSLAGQPHPKATLHLQALGAPSVEVQVSSTDLNTGTTTITLPATLVYLSGERVNLTAPGLW
jgi:hypothetical protein